MGQKTKYQRLMTWNNAKQCLIDAIRGGDIYPQEWPERLGLEVLAVLQVLGEPVKTKTLTTLLLNSDTPRQARQYSCPQIIDSIFDETISPDDFRKFLSQNGLKPSAHVLAWFDALNTSPVKNEDDTESCDTNQREFTKWMFETWENEGRPTGTPFFDSLKKYADSSKYPKSPIREHWTTGPKGAGIRYSTGSTTKHMTKKNIQTMASRFKKLEAKNPVKNKNR